MNGLIKKIDYENKVITISVDDTRIKDDVKYSFENLDDMNNIENKLLVYLDKVSFKNGKVEFKDIRFDEFKIDDIIVNGIIGSGDNGVVYQGYDTFFERNVALKVWLPNYRDGKKKSNKTRFKEEVKKMANINQQSVTTIYKRDKIFSFDLVIMELVNGITLKKWLSSYKPNFSSRCKVIRDLFLEIEKLHKDGIHHGDLHLENIMINSRFGRIDNDETSNLVHIIDFGTSIFSGKIDSNKRECKLMMETFDKIIYEIEKNKLLDLDTDSLSSEMITKIYRGVVNVLCLLNLNTMSHQAIVDVCMLITLLPVYNINYISNMIAEKLKKDGGYGEEIYINHMSDYIYNIYRLYRMDTDELKNITIGEAYNNIKNEFYININKSGFESVLEVLYTVDDFESVLNERI